MKNNQIENQAFSVHQKQFILESIIKSLLLGAVFGFLTTAITALAFWYFDIKLVWLSVPVFIVSTVLYGVLLFFTKYKLREKYMARKLDKLGLDERLITMTELKDDTSFIAQLQREDATKASKKVDGKLIKFVVSIPVICCLVAAFIFGGGMITVNALSSTGVIRSGKQIIEDINTVPTQYVNLNYVIEGSGVIMGEESQVLVKGESGTPIMAVPDYGYAFVRWSDGYEEPYRVDLNVESDTLLTAIFEVVANINEKEQVTDGSSMIPVDPEGQEGQGCRPDWQDPEESPDKPDNNPSQATSGQDAYMVYDGKTYYGGKVYSEAVKDAINEVENKKDLTDDEEDAINSYYNNIKK